MVNLITFTTYDNESNLSGTPFVFGFTDKSQNNDFDNTGTEADLEIPPPPPPGDGAGNPISTSYIDTMYVKVSDGANDINAYQYLLDISDNNDIALDLAVRDYNANNVVFKYNHSDISGVLGTLNITNDSWTIDLVDSSVSGTGPSVTENGDERTVTLPHLANNTFYTMNLKQYVADSGPTEVTQTISFIPGWTWFSIYIVPNVSTVSSLFPTPPIGTKVLSSQLTLTYSTIFFVTAWRGGPLTLNANSGYKMFNAHATENIELSITEEPPTSTTLTFIPGWTWFSYPSITSRTVSSILPTPPIGTKVLSSQLTLTYSTIFFVTAWRGGPLTLNPNSGYKIFNPSTTENIEIILNFD
jgi:hypothetical protein